MYLRDTVNGIKHCQRIMVSTCHINVKVKPTHLFSKQKAGKYCDLQFAHNKAVNPSVLSMASIHVSTLRCENWVRYQAGDQSTFPRWQPLE